MVGPALMDTPATQTRSYRNLHVQGFDTSVTDAMLRSWFAPCGTVRSAKVMMNARTGVSRCIGFVLFESEDEGLLAFHRMNGSTQMSANNAKCVLVIQPSDHDGEQAAYETSTVFLRNIPSTITEADLHKLTSRFGDVVKLAISNIASRKRKPKPSEQSQQPTAGSEDDDAAGTQNGNAAAALLDLKMASVDFVTVDSARQCIEALHNTNPFGLCVTLMAKFGDTEKIREIRKANRKVRAAGASAPSSIPSPSCPETTPTKDANPTSHKVDFLSAPVSVSSASSSATPTPPPGFVTTGLATAGSTPSPLLPLHQQPSPASSLMTSTSSIPSQLPQGPTFMMPPQFAPAPHVPQSNPFAPALFTFASASQLQPQPHFYDLHPPATAMYPPHAMYIAVPVTENPAGVAAPTFLFPTAGPGYHHHQPTYVVMHHPMPAPQH